MRFSTNVLTILFLLISTSFAQSEESKPLVILVGGAGSTAEQMSLWQKQALENSKYNKNFEFKAYHMPVKTIIPAEAVVRNNEPTVNEIFKKIIDQMTQNPDREIILAGHSSGSAITNEVVLRIKKYDDSKHDPQLSPHYKSQIKLLILEGFRPSQEIKEVKIECWSAEATENPKVKAPNYPFLRIATCAGKNREDKISGCSDKKKEKFQECLHFSLVNLNLKKGYNDINPNLNWLNDFLSQTKSSTRPQHNTAAGP